MQEQEIWRPVVGYEGWYEVSTLGRVRSLSRTILCNNRYEAFYKGKILSPTPNVRWRYMTLYLCKDGVRKRVRVHRLVAMAFLPNPDNLPEVNHKDANRQNNRLDNLEWCDRKYNSNYGDARKKQQESARKNKAYKRRPKRISQYSLDGTYLATYDTSYEAARAIGHPNSGSNLRACARGNSGHQTACGFVWKYED